MKTPRVCALLLPLLAGCPAADGDSNGDGARFETCLEVREAALDEGDSPADGEYALHLGGDEAQPWTAYCRGMATGEPEEFLTVNDELNYSQITNGIRTAQTRFRRFRIDPVSLTIDPLDATFAESTSPDEPDVPPFPFDLTFIPAGWAEFQQVGGEQGPAAEAALDLEGTPFAFDASIVAEPELPFFCAVVDSAANPVDATQVEVAASLEELNLFSHDDQEARVVMDCDSLGVSVLTSASAPAFPLAYAGSN